MGMASITQRRQDGADEVGEGSGAKLENFPASVCSSQVAKLEIRDQAAKKKN